MTLLYASRQNEKRSLATVPEVRSEMIAAGQRIIHAVATAFCPARNLAARQVAVHETAFRLSKSGK
jgi:hypothetical protein